jgi:hypothetical protein
LYVQLHQTFDRLALSLGPGIDVDIERLVEGEGYGVAERLRDVVVGGYGPAN